VRALPFSPCAGVLVSPGDELRKNGSRPPKSTRLNQTQIEGLGILESGQLVKTSFEVFISLINF
jgi:hypothetical protein